MPYLIRQRNNKQKIRKIKTRKFRLNHNNSVLDIFNEFFKFLGNRDVSHGELNRWKIGIIYFGNDDTWSKMALNNLVAYGLGYVGFTESID